MRILLTPALLNLATSFSISACCLFTSVAVAETYYVWGDKGNDTTNGKSWGTAWKTLKWAANQSIAGDTVIIRKSTIPYRYLPVARSGEEGKPIAFLGERPDSPPVLSGGSRLTQWLGPNENGVWRHKARKIDKLIEDNKTIKKASSPHCKDGRWYWLDDTIYYRPRQGNPARHELEIATSAGGIVIGKHSWIIVEDLFCRLGGGAGVSITGGSNNIARRIKVQWHWQGVQIAGHSSKHNIIEDCHVLDNRDGVYIKRGASYNTVRGCVVEWNGRYEIHGRNGDRAGIAIGERGPNIGNNIENNEIRYNGGPYSDPGLIAYDAPKSRLVGNSVHHNYGSGLWVTLWSDGSYVANNKIYSNGQHAIENKQKAVAALSIRRSRNVTVRDNIIRDNWVAGGFRFETERSAGPEGGLDVHGNPGDLLPGIKLINNEVSGTIGGPNIYIDQRPHLPELLIQPEKDAPRWYKPRLEDNQTP